MEQLEINFLLLKAYESDFLDSILLLKEKEKEYKLSDFYKITKIPLMELYKNYYLQKQSKESIVKQLDYWLENIDEEILTEKVAIFISNLKNNPEIKELLNSFSIERLGEEREELEHNIKKLPK